MRHDGVPSPMTGLLAQPWVKRLVRSAKLLLPSAFSFLRQVLAKLSANSISFAFYVILPQNAFFWLDGSETYSPRKPRFKAEIPSQLLASKGPADSP
jgi:hypothetical protein